MTAFVKFAPWLMSAITIWMMAAAGNKYRGAWLVGLVNQALWLAWILSAHSLGSDTLGLLPMNAALWVVYTRNYLKWSKS